MLAFLFLLKDWFKTEEKKKKEKIKEELTLQYIESRETRIFEYSLFEI